jgi:hypothetical protein
MRSVAAALVLIPALARADPPATPAEGAAPPAASAVVEAPAAPAPPAPPAAPAAEPLPRLGLLLDVGVPDGAVVAVVFRPVPPLRFSAGAAYNYAGYGVRGGIGWVPFRWALSPSLNVEAGRYFESDLTWIADHSSGVPVELRPLLKHVGYSYASAQLGIEFGSPRGFSLNLRLGLSYFWTTIHGVGESVANVGGTTATLEVQDPRFRATLPSLKVGMLYYF